MSRLWGSSGAALFTGGAGLVCALSLSGCLPVDVDSDAVRTRGLYGRFAAATLGDGIVSVSGALYVGGGLGTLVELRGDDELWATLDGTERRLGGGDGSYRTQFESNGDKKKVTVAFRRGAELEGAPESTVTLPRAFQMSLDGLEPGDDLERGKPLTIRWSPSNPGGSMAIVLQGSCIIGAGSWTSDDGEHLITGEEIQHFLIGKSCDVVVELKRHTVGTVDPNFEEGGYIEAYQVRRLNFTSTPSADERKIVGDLNQGGTPGLGEGGAAP